MSRIGQKPILIPKEVTLTLNSGVVNISGPKGQMTINLSEGIKLNIAQDKATLLLENETTHLKALSGLNRTNISNAIYGVTNLWSKTLEMVGVGFRAEATPTELTLSLGFSHPVKIIAPKDITFKVTENKITVSGIDKYLVGEEAAKIRRLKPPEPYKGKGIKYSGEKIRKKAGKAKAIAGAPAAK